VAVTTTKDKKFGGKKLERREKIWFVRTMMEKKKK
jgi:hypothetical protein